MAMYVEPAWRKCGEQYLCGGIETPDTTRLLSPEPAFVYSPRRVGKGDSGGMILLCGRRQSYFPFHCLVGPDWPIVLIVYAMIISINTLVLPFISALGWPVLLLGLLGAFGLLVSYSAVACSDPGIVYNGDEAPIINSLNNNQDLETRALVGSNLSDEDKPVTDGAAPMAAVPHQSVQDVDGTWMPPRDIEEGPSAVQESITAEPSGAVNSSSHKVAPVSPVLINGVPSEVTTMECTLCDLHRPRSARHCYYCGVCVENLDHHCPWCGKCIGKNNIKFFHAFLTCLCFQTYFLAGSVVYLIISRYVHWPVGPKV